MNPHTDPDVQGTHYEGCELWHIACAQKRMAALDAVEKSSASR
jgi:hypothetical protein